MFLSTLHTTGRAAVRQPYEPYVNDTRPAGKVTAAGDAASECLKTTERPPTPETVHRFKGPNLQDPGTIFRHPGLAQDPVPEGVFGVKSVFDDGGVAATLSTEPKSDVEAWKRQQVGFELDLWVQAFSSEPLAT